MEGEGDLMSNLETYRAQLKQVEAALMIDDDNEELQKLKVDLQEVIVLTLDLLSIDVNDEETAAKESSPIETEATFEEILEQSINPTKPEDTIKASKGEVTKASSTQDEVPSSTEYTPSANKKQKRKERKEGWKAGDLCEAIWSGDGRLHDAMISYVAEDEKSCTVRFEKYGTVEVVETSSLKEKPISSSSKRKADDTENWYEDKKDKPKEKLSRAEQEKKREQRKKKLLKKQQRMKDFEEQREKEKNKWLDFYKGGSKGKGKSRGIMKKSIFATPDSSSGKVGVGTCGIGGKGMTSYQSSNQYIYKR